MGVADSPKTGPEGGIYPSLPGVDARDFDRQPDTLDKSPTVDLFPSPFNESSVLWKHPFKSFLKNFKDLQDIKIEKLEKYCYAYYQHAKRRGEPYGMQSKLTETVVSIPEEEWLAKAKRHEQKDLLPNASVAEVLMGDFASHVRTANVAVSSCAYANKMTASKDTIHELRQTALQAIDKIDKFASIRPKYRIDTLKIGQHELEVMGVHAPDVESITLANLNMYLFDKKKCKYKKKKTQSTQSTPTTPTTPTTPATPRVPRSATFPTVANNIKQMFKFKRSRTNENFPAGEASREQGPAGDPEA